MGGKYKKKTNNIGICQTSLIFLDDRKTGFMHKGKTVVTLK